jgi:hypothetical protein
MWASLTLMPTKDKPIHLRRYSWEKKDVSSPSSLGIEPFSWFSSVQIEWQGNVSKLQHSLQHDKPVHVHSASVVNDVSAPSSLGIDPVSWFSSVQIEWQENVSKRDIHANKRKNNARTEEQVIQQRQFSELARNWTGELIIICSNRMVRKCEQASHSCERDKPMHVRRYSRVNKVSAPSSLGIFPLSWLESN